MKGSNKNISINKTIPDKTAQLRSDGPADMLMTLPDMARYPFIGHTRQYLLNSGITVEYLCSEKFSPAHQAAYERIAGAVQGREGRAAANHAQSIFAYLSACSMLAAANARTVAGEYARAEADRARRHVLHDLAIRHANSAPDARGERLVLGVVRSLTNMRLIPKGQLGEPSHEYAVAIPAYLKWAVTARSKEYDLVNRRVRAGRVTLSAGEVSRIVRAAVIRHILKATSQVDIPDAGDMLPYVDRIRRLEAGISPGIAEAPAGGLPPCMVHLVEQLEAGGDVPHAGRVALCAYMNRMGKSQDEVVEYYRNAPDFDEKVTRYQVEHIFTGGAGGEGYSCYSCRSMEGYGLCRRTDECGLIRNPVQFGRRRGVDDRNN